MNFDDLTDKERAQIEVERNVHDLGSVVAKLCELRRDDTAKPYLNSEIGEIYSALLTLQLLCSDIQASRAKPQLVRAS